MSGIGRRILELRKELRKTVTEFAKPLGYSPSYISAITKGKRYPSDAFIKSLCAIYGVREKWLIGGEGSIYKDKRNAGEKFEEPPIVREYIEALHQVAERNSGPPTQYELAFLEMLRDIHTKNKEGYMQIIGLIAHYFLI